MQTYELLDRFELLYPTNSNLSDLRRAYIDQDLSSIFRLANKFANKLDIEDLRKAVLEQNLHSIFRLIDLEDVRKLVMEDNTWSLWKILAEYKETQFIAAFKNFFVNKVDYDKDCFSRGQLQSKLWLVSELKKLDLDLGTIFLCAGWYATLATMIFESGMRVNKIRSFDIDPNVWKIAEIFNKPWVTDSWQFKASTKDIFDIDFVNDNYITERSDGTIVELNNSPDTIINTSCEHIKDFDKWYNKIPKGKLLILQCNNFFEVEEHVNCSVDTEDFSRMTPMSECLFLGELPLEKYTRFMKIGYK
jgi:hypothetical protein